MVPWPGAAISLCRGDILENLKAFKLSNEPCAHMVAQQIRNYLRASARTSKLQLHTHIPIQSARSISHQKGFAITSESQCFAKAMYSRPQCSFKLDHVLDRWGGPSKHHIGMLFWDAKQSITCRHVVRAPSSPHSTWGSCFFSIRVTCLLLPFPPRPLLHLFFARLFLLVFLSNPPLPNHPAPFYHVIHMKFVRFCPRRPSFPSRILCTKPSIFKSPTLSQGIHF